MRLALVAVLLAANPAALRAKDDTPKAEMKVRGLGWWQDYEQRRSLERLLGHQRGTTLDANAIEDATFLLVSALTDEGYVKPEVEAVMTRTDGHEVRVTFGPQLTATLPRPLVVKRVELHVKRGQRYRFNAVQFQGLHAISEDDAKQYFLGESVLIARSSTRAYSPTHLRRAIEGIEGELQRRGYADADVKATRVKLDDKTGHVSVDVAVNEGPRWIVTAVQAETPSGEKVDLPFLPAEAGKAWSQLWQQDVSGGIRKHYYELGYPDVAVELQPHAAPPANGVRQVTVAAEVRPGTKVRIGKVGFEGAEKTKESVLRRRVKSQPGQPLNPLEMDQARFRLARLGVFDSVNVRYEPPTGPVRDPIFSVQEGRQMEVNLLMGYGSYEELRGGVELRQFNLFGRAHQSRLLLVQSVKSTQGEYSYTVPELFGESIDGSARVFGLQRQETSFLRQEYGVNTALAMPLPWIGANATVGYTFQSLRNRDNTLTTESADQKQVTAASIDINIVRDRRDNPLRPRRGYRWAFEAETASQLLGSAVDYQRFVLSGSYHTPWGSGRWIHLGLSHGFITTFGATTDVDLPVNKRFFPGGDNSIRGYQSGEAAPIGPDGKFIGAKSYVLANLELEQALTPKWSAIVFADGLGTAVRLADYPFNERLYSAGVGLRYETLIGPLRVEYGRNLNPRPTDPKGTLLFSVGFPF
ncbi:MAG TPA: BamA/TamA family outer membrane protein [Opitutus sp.]|nr:BamA/TamA family outer membrane protein [Opitutus sp.]